MFEMEDLPMEPAPAPKPTVRKKRTVRKRPLTARQMTEKATRKQTATTGKRPVKPMPKMRTPGEQPRDANGRWVKVGRAVWTGTKATGRAAKHVLFGTAAVIGGTVAAAQSGHRIVKKSMGKKRTTVKRKRVRRRKR